MKELKVLYGSQTGFAEDVAFCIREEAFCKGVECSAQPMNSYDVKSILSESVLVFVCSTTGQGDEPDNMKKFWRFLLQKALPSDFLKDVRIAVLGLGDSSYTKFNFTAKKLHKRLLQLNAISILHLGLADDQHEYGADFIIDEWTRDFWLQLRSLNLLTSFVSTQNLNMSSNYEVSHSNNEFSLMEEKRLKNIAREGISFVPLSLNKRVTSLDHFQDTRHIVFDISGVEIKYEVGDVVALYPKNSEENVIRFLDLFGIAADQVVDIKRRGDEKVALPKSYDCFSNIIYPCKSLTWHYLASTYFDFQRIPKRYFFILLSKFSNLPAEDIKQEKLREFASKEGQEALFDYVIKPRRTILEVLSDFHEVCRAVSLSQLFDLIPAIKPRQFSIASSMLANPKQIDILVAIVDYKTKDLLHRRKGLCSNWLAHASLKEELLPIKLEKGSFKLPPTFYDTSNACSVIMIGPGTGVSPFRSMIQERIFQGISKNYLFFGCRFPDKDHYFKDEFVKLQYSTPVKTLLVSSVAFSRISEGRAYVQDKIKENYELLYNLIENDNAYVFVAGNSKQMPQDVRRAFIEVFQSACNMSFTLAEKYLLSLEKTSRYQCEVWA